MTNMLEKVESTMGSGRLDVVGVVIVGGGSAGVQA
jgi:hypothetical protein